MIERAMLLSELLPDVAGVPADLLITGLVQDSRAVKLGNAFVAIGEFGPHGLNYVNAAKAAGASIVIYDAPDADVAVPTDAIRVDALRTRLGAMADQFHGQPSAAMHVVAVTGTSGKTSTVQLLAQAFTLLKKTAGTIGTLGAGLYGDPKPTGFTTPLVLQTHALLAEMHAQGAEVIAMEVSSHALAQGRVDQVHFDIAVFTNLSRDHLDYHKDMQDYADTKAKLFAWPGLKTVVVNQDDAYAEQMLSAVASDVNITRISAAEHANAQVYATQIQLDAAGIRFQLHHAGQAYTVQSTLLGRFNVDNLLTVVAVLHASGYSMADILDILPQLQPVAGRMNRLGGDDQHPLAVVDYSHKPDPLKQALLSLKDHLQGELICVFGCGGERDRGKRPEMAAIAESIADRVIVTDDNPRNEDGDAIVADIMAGFNHPNAVKVERNREKAIIEAIQTARPGDIILIAGKGHETYQEVAGVTHAFDDREVAERALSRYMEGGQR